MSKSVIDNAWTATADQPIHIDLTHGALKAEATYPVSDNNTSFDKATRFRVMTKGVLVLDKLIDDMPVDLRILTTEGGAEVALLDTFSGGAHCCAGSSLADPRKDQPGFASRNWGNVGYKLIKSADGSGYVFLTADNALAYAFSSFAGSTFPIQIFSYRDSSFVDVTHEYKQAVEADAALHWREYLTDASSGVAPQSSLVAYLADEYRLGQSSNAWKKVHATYGDDADFNSKATDWLRQNKYSQ